MMDFVHGNQILNLNNIRLEQGSPATNVIADRYLDAWTPTNPNGEVSAHQLHAGHDRVGHHDRPARGRIVRAPPQRHARLSVPDRLLSRFGITMTRVYVTGSNSLTWTNYSGFNPDVSSLGWAT